MTTGSAGRIAVVLRGNSAAGTTVTPENSRLAAVFEALTAVGFDTQLAVYSDDLASDIRTQPLRCDGVLVWVDPISGGEDRTRLDAILREVASQGVWVSAHPDVILKMGTKEVLYQTRKLGWGSDTYLYRTIEDFREHFPGRVASSGPRVLKQHRGNGGRGVWKVELVGDASQLCDAGWRAAHQPDRLWDAVDRRGLADL